MFSGGVGSWAAAKRVVERHGSADVTLLFTDTLIEDGDLYRFIDQAAADIFRNMPPNLVRIAEGRTPWQVFEDENMIGNSQADLCSRILKRDLADRWLTENCDPAETTIYLGIDWTEKHRFDNDEGGGARNRYARLGWRCEAPMIEAPFLTKPAMLRLLQAAGIIVPRLYKMGFPHNNCGGFCIKAGQAHFALLHRMLPERYASHEAAERAFNEARGTGHSVLRDRTGGETKPLTLQAFREQIEATGQVDLFDWGGCGCFGEAA